MSWAYITQEQGQAVEAICKKHYTAPGYRDEDCPTCPIRGTCRMELPGGETAEAAAARTRIFETALAEAAAKVKEDKGNEEA